MKLFRNILTVAAVISAVAAQAQSTTEPELVRGKWSLEASGGAGSFWQLRSNDETGKRYIAPAFTVGGRYQIRPWVRAGVELGYMQLDYRFKNIATFTTQDDKFTIDGKPAILTTNGARVSASNHSNTINAGLHVDFDLLHIKENKAPFVHLLVGTGLGYMHFWTMSNSIWAYDQEAVAKGETYFNVYNHSFVKMEGQAHKADALYIPVRLGLEFDVNHYITVGARAEYKYLPLNVELTPKHMLTGMFTIAYTFDRKENSREAIVRRNKEKAEQYEQEITNLNSELDRTKQAKNRAESQARQSQQELENARQALKECEERDRQFSSNSVFFSAAKNEINSEQMKTMAAIAKLLKENPTATAVVNGYASKDGRADFNQKLSEKRAATVRDTLVKKYGVDPERITAVGHGVTESLYMTLSLNRVAVVQIYK